MTAAMLALLNEANGSPDGTILAIGFNRHGYTVEVNRRTVTVHAAATALALERRGLISFFKSAAWGTVYKITATGREAL